MMYYRIRGKRKEHPARLSAVGATVAAVLAFWPLAVWPPREAGGTGYAVTAAWIGGLVLLTAIGGLIRWIRIAPPRSRGGGGT